MNLYCYWGTSAGLTKLLFLVHLIWTGCWADVPRDGKTLQPGQSGRYEMCSSRCFGQLLVEGLAGWELDRASCCENLCDVGSGAWFCWARIGGGTFQGRILCGHLCCIVHPPDLYPSGSLTVHPWKYIPSQRKGLSSFPIIFQGAFVVKLRGCRALKNDVFVFSEVEWYGSAWC